MEQQLATAKAISEFGVLVVIAAVAIVAVVVGLAVLSRLFGKFLNNLIVEFKAINVNMSETNKNMEKALGNMSVSLEIIKNQTGDISDNLKIHDGKADTILNKMTEVCTRIEKCPK